MCGFFGVLGDFSDYNSLRKSLSVINHRGPDALGIWIKNTDRISLGHVRLSVVDLSSSGDQPMISSDGRFVLTFNGEIYNFDEIRNEIDSLYTKFPWRGKSDSEVLLEAISVWGLEKTLDKANGMFAFALWDRKKLTLSLVRDRFGEKPLYYGWQKDLFLFGSDLASFRENSNFINEIDRNSLALFMRLSYIPAPHSIYKDIFKLLPGHYLNICLNKKEGELIRYWDEVEIVKKSKNNSFEGSSNEALSTLENLLTSSIESKMLADVPVGAFLSGGVDSSLVASIMQSLSSRSIKTFTIGFNDQRFNEAKFARDVATYIGSDHTEYYFSNQEILEYVPKIKDVYSEPFADSSQLPTILVSQLAKSDVTVALTGDAGDELFCGYRTYTVAQKLESLRSNILTKQLSKLLSFQSLQNGFGFSENLIRSSLNLRKDLSLTQKLLKVAEVLDASNKQELFLSLVSRWNNPSLLVLNSFEYETKFDLLYDKIGYLNFKEYMMLVDTLTYLPDNNLCKVDRASMFSSLETRIPMLDSELVKFAWSLPIEIKTFGKEGKWPLKQILYRYVPRKIIDRPKMGFSVPLGEWLRGPLKDWAENLITEERLTREGYLDSRMVRKAWEEHLSEKYNWEHKLWNILIFQNWLESTKKN